MSLMQAAHRSVMKCSYFISQARKERHSLIFSKGTWAPHALGNQLWWSSEIPGESTFARGARPRFPILWATSWHLLKLWQMNGLAAAPAKRRAQPPRPSSAAQRTSHSGQGCPAAGKLHLKHAEQQHAQNQSTKAGGHVSQHLHGAEVQRGPQGIPCLTASGSILRILWLLRENPSSPPDFSVAFSKLFLIFLCPHLEKSATGASLRFDGLTCYQFHCVQQVPSISS